MDVLQEISLSPFFLIGNNFVNVCFVIFSLGSPSSIMLYSVFGGGMVSKARVAFMLHNIILGVNCKKLLHFF